MLLTSRTNNLPSIGLHEVHAREIRADRIGCRNSHVAELGLSISAKPLRHGATVHIGHPVAAASAHHRDSLARADKYAEVPEWRPGAGHVVLEIIHTVHVFFRRQVGKLRGSSLMPRPCAPKSGFSTSGDRGSSRAAMLRAASLPFDGECCRRRQSCMLHQECRHRLVDAALYRLSRVPYRHGKLRKSVKDTQTAGNRFERAGGDGAHKDGVGQNFIESGNR